jgi:DNA-binding SARP family transcriptional activator/predicted ATPase/tetratricopeptide (TPR) repeat protein
MSRLSLAVLGPFQAFLDNHAVRFRSWKERALLAYLATEIEGFHERSSLVGLLWSNMSERDGLSNLRLTLSRLRQSLRDSDVGGFITVTRTSLRWNLAAPADVDIHTFRHAIERPLIATATPIPYAEASIERLRQAVELYRGDFLSGLDAGDEEPFSEWSRMWRERLHQQALTALYTLAENALQHAHYPIAEDYAFRQIALERWREEAYRQLMTALAGAGQRTAALHHYGTLVKVLAEELGMQPDPATTSLYHRIRDNQLALPSVPPASLLLRAQATTNGTAPARPVAISGTHNLPTVLTPFMGREPEIETILNRIRERGERFVTLVGEGGVGKSRLATTIGQQVLSDFPQGVWWVSLAELEAKATSPEELLADCIARTFNLPLGGQSPVKEQLFAYLQNKKLLLILDNFETIYAAAPLVFALLQQCTQVTVLITTREALHYQSESVVRIEGLPVPATRDPNPLAYSGMQLLVERAERTGWQFASRSIDSLVLLGRFLRGVPLALELAGTLVAEMPLEQLVDEVREGYDALATTMRDVPPRHRTMQAIFETSWQLLTAHQQGVLAQLGLFRGRFDREAAEAVAQASTRDMEALVAKSLVRQDSNGWFSLHDHLREFAHRQWHTRTRNGQNGHREPPDRSTLREAPTRHAAHYLGWIATMMPRLFGNSLPTTLTQVQEKRGNLYQAWQWAIEAEAWQLIAPAIAPLRRALHILADLRDGVRLFGMLVTALDKHHPLYDESVAGYVQFLMRAGKSEEAYALVEQRLNATTSDSVHYADLLRLKGDLLTIGEEVHQTDTYYQQALPIVRRAGDRVLETSILISASGAMWVRHEYARAQEYAEIALPIAREIGDFWAEVALLNRMGVLAINQDFGMEIAHDYFSRALELTRLLNDRQTEGLVTSNLGTVSEYLLDYGSAYDYYYASVLLQSDLGNVQSNALSHSNVGRLLCLLGNYKNALPYLETALQLYSESHNLRGQGLVRTYLGMTLFRQGKHTIGIEHLEQATDILRTLHLVPFIPFPLTHLGKVYVELGEYGKAEQYLQEAAQIRRDIKDVVLLKDTLAILVQIYLAEENYSALEAVVVELAANFAATGDVGAEYLVTNYLALYQGQLALNHPAAPETLAHARMLFSRIIGMMKDPAMRESYRAMPAHQLLERL